MAEAVTARGPADRAEQVFALPRFVITRDDLPLHQAAGTAAAELNVVLGVRAPRRGRAIALPNLRLGLARMNAPLSRCRQIYWLRVRSVSATPDLKVLLSRSLNVVLATGS